MGKLTRKQDNRSSISDTAAPLDAWSLPAPLICGNQQAKTQRGLRIVQESEEGRTVVEAHEISSVTPVFQPQATPKAQKRRGSNLDAAFVLFAIPAIAFASWIGLVQLRLYQESQSATQNQLLQAQNQLLSKQNATLLEQRRQVQGVICNAP